MKGERGKIGWIFYSLSLAHLSVEVARQLFVESGHVLGERLELGNDQVVAKDLRDQRKVARQDVP